MTECQCTSKKHGHSDRCSRPVNGQADFCDECQQQMIVDRLTQDETNLTPAEGPLPEKTYCRLLRVIQACLRVGSIIDDLFLTLAFFFRRPGCDSLCRTLRSSCRQLALMCY